MCSGLLRAMETFSAQAAWNNPDRYWISVLTLVDWVGNVLLPLYGAGASCARGCAFFRVIGAHDDRRGVGPQPGCGDVLFWALRFIAIGRILGLAGLASLLIPYEKRHHGGLRSALLTSNGLGVGVQSDADR
jgi:hypothetical protein